MIDDEEAPRAGEYPIVMPVHERDRLPAKRAITALRSHGHKGALNVLARPSDVLAADLQAVGANLLDENEIVPGLSYSAVESALEEFGAAGVRSPGWLLQQFLKMGFARYTNAPHYVVWDADTIPLRPISFETGKEKRALFVKGEDFPPYFEMNRRLLDLPRMTSSSFVAEVMCIRSSLMRDLLAAIEDKSGLPFWRAILAELSPESIISEFELYGNYALFRDEKVELCTPRSFRFGAKLVGLNPSPSQLEWLSRDFDTVTLESYHDRRMFPRITRLAIFRTFVGARNFCTFINLLAKPLSRNTWTSRRYFYF